MADLHLISLSLGSRTSSLIVSISMPRKVRVLEGPKVLSGARGTLSSEQRAWNLVRSAAQPEEEEWTIRKSSK